MAIKTKNYGTITLSSSYIAKKERLPNNTVLSTTLAASVDDSAVYQAKLSDIGVPAGSTVHSARVTFSIGTASLHGYAQRTLNFDGVANTFFNTGDAVNVDTNSTFYIRFETAKNNTSWPADPDLIGETTTRTNLSVFKVDNFTVEVTYTPPYTAPVVSNVKLNNSLATIYAPANTNLTLTWSAVDGAYNPIATYQIDRKDGTGAWTTIKTGLTVKSYSVKSHVTPGSYSQFRVRAVAEYSNSADVASPLVYSYTPVTIPMGPVLTPSTQYEGQNVTLSWNASSGGVGTTVTGYNVYRNGVLAATVTGTSYTFPAPAAGSYTYTVAAVASVSGYNSNQSTGVTLTALQPASSFTIDQTSVPLDGTTPITVRVTPADPSYWHEVMFQLPDLMEEYAILGYGDVTLEHILTPASWCAALPNATSATVRVVVNSYDGTNYVGSTERTVAITVPASVVPTVTLAATLSNLFGSLCLKGRSVATLTASASGVYGSTIQSYQFTGGGYSGTANPFVTPGTLNTAGTIPMTVTVTDSRGRTGTHTVNVTVTDYSPPSIQNVVKGRTDVNGNPVDAGEYIGVIAALVHSAVTGNSYTGLVYTKVAGTGVWSAGTAIYNNTQVVLSGAAQANVYDVRIVLTDTVGNSAEYLGTVGAALFMFDFRNDRAGVGRLAGDTTKTFLIPSDWTTNFPVNAHTHVKANITDFTHTHVKTDITDFSHTHVKADITDFAHTHDYLPLAGGTVTGNVDFSVAASITGQGFRLAYPLASTSITNLNNITQEWCLATSGLTNIPTAHYYFVHTIFYGDTSGNATQTAYGYNNTAVYWRRRTSGTWSAWTALHT